MLASLFAPTDPSIAANTSLAAAHFGIFIYQHSFSEPMPVRETLKEKIAGEICLSSEPGMTIRKWRKLFAVSQKELAVALAVSPSVISDYEAGRRKSPGIGTIRRVVETILEIETFRHYVRCN